MGTTPDTGDDGPHCRRDLDRVVRDVAGVTPADVRGATAAGVATSTVGEDDEHCVFEVTGLDCRTCAGLVECVIAERTGVSNVSANAPHGTVRVDYDPTTTDPASLRAALADLGYPVETTDEAFRNRRAAQFREARLITGFLAGLMALVPYAAVVYPTRFAFWPYDPRVVALLERALETAFATHFYINLALLSGIVLVVTGKPFLDDAEAALRARSPDRTVLFVAAAVGLYAYSTATAFLVDGGVYYDVVILVVVAAATWRAAAREAATATTDRDAADPEPEPGDAVPASPPDAD